jgi:hypothetical protein
MEYWTIPWLKRLWKERPDDLPRNVSLLINMVNSEQPFKRSNTGEQLNSQQAQLLGQDTI